MLLLLRGSPRHALSHLLAGNTKPASIGRHVKFGQPAVPIIHTGQANGSNNAPISRPAMAPIFDGV